MSPPVPEAAIKAAARAYCLSRYDYGGAYLDAAAREAHIAADTESTAAEAWLLSVLEAAAPHIATAERDRLADHLELLARCMRDPYFPGDPPAGDTS